MAKGSGTPVWTSGVRGFALTAAVAAGLSVTVSTSGAKDETRTLEIYNIHTKETSRVTYKAGGRYDADGLKKLNHVMRDWRLDIATKMDPKLFDLLWELKHELGATQPIHLISGHRSSKTNTMLRRTRGGQAKKSLHIRGSAADVYFPGVPLERLRNAALVKQRGGVGYYPRSGQPFVHVDTGRVRHWPRIPSNKLASILKRGTSKVPVRQVVETRVASIAAPAPAAKPRSALVETPAPMTLASLDRQAMAEKAAGASAVVASAAGDGATAPSSGSAPDQVRSRDWGESWLAPSRPRELQKPRSKPRPQQDIVVAGLSTTVAPRSHSARLSTALAPSMTGYADPGAAVAGGGRRLDGTNTPLAGMLADAERLSALTSLGVKTDPAEAEAESLAAPVGAAQAVQSAKLQPAAPEPLTRRPVVTASLSPAAFLPLKHEVQSRFRAILFAPAHAHVFEPKTDIVENFEPRDGVDKGLNFAGALFSKTEVGAFAPMPAEAGYNPATLRVAQADDRRDGGVLAYARRMISWLLGD